MDCANKLVTSQQNYSGITTNKCQLGNHYVKVFYRISSLCKIDQKHVKMSDSTMFIRRLEQLKDITKQAMPPSYWEFVTDGIFYKAQQEDVYNEVIENVVERLAKGQSGILVGFGQTGSGKSTTIGGLEFVSNENFGMAPRVVKQLLEIKKQFNGSNRMKIEMSYIEMSKNAVYDLFKQYPNNLNPWHVDNESTKIIIHTESQALKELYIGEARKETKETKNYLSHINTSVLTFYVTVEDLSFNNVNQVKRRLHLIDMAGSDTVGNLTCVSKTKREVGSANLAKTSLEQFFLCLVEKSQKAIKSMLRNNPLIFFLKDDLNINSALRFIGHINPDKEHLQISLSMMRFGQIIKGYKPSSIQIEQPAKMTAENKIRYLQRKLQEVEEERIQNSMLLNVDLTSNINSERAEHLQKMVKDYLNNHISEVDIIRVADASMAFKMFKDLYTQWEQERQKLYKEASLSFGKRISDSDISLQIQKKKWSSRSSSTMATTKGSKEKRRIKKSKDASVDEKLAIVVEKADKQISVQSFFDSRVKSPTLKTINSHDISSGSISQSTKRRRSKFTTSIQRRTSEVKQRSVSSFTDGIISDTLVTSDMIPNQIEAWNAFLKEPKYTYFMEEYKINEKNINSVYEQYIEALKLLNEQKVNIDAIKQEIIETKMIMKFKSTDSDKNTEAIFMEAEAKCKEKKENAEKDHIHQKEIVFRYLSELKIYLDRRRDLKEELTGNFDTFCKEKFNLPIPTVKSPTEIKGSADSIQLNEFHVDENISEKLIEPVEISESQIGQFKKVMQKERTKVVKMRAFDTKKIYDKKCY
ncbi:uncharacterized protein LOC114344107 isoform X2 [Diabrotica virgifera virgifera]|uniref:Kinesin motor domain-containing protein n=2 Tax=Diabrotica virgifera virgifera TaxID=50390 RepID=A0ABM5JQ54_DIAVI|nr:uncharacterized protein LOC114344107 isoform X2 [Diabrotica virgifera virgifera]